MRIQFELDHEEDFFSIVKDNPTISLRRLRYKISLSKIWNTIPIASISLSRNLIMEQIELRFVSGCWKIV